jgi:hypothetical protein
VQRLNGTLAGGDEVAGAEQNFRAAWDGNGSDPHAGPTAAAVAAGAPTHGGLLTESPRTLQSRLHAAQTNAAAAPAQHSLSLHGPRDSPRGADHPHHPSLSLLQPGMPSSNNNRRGSLFVAMRPAELPGVPEMLQKLKGGEVGGADLRGRRPSQESSFSGTPRSATPSSEMREAEDGLNGVLEHNHTNNDVQVLGADGAVVGQIVRAGPGDQVEPLLTPGRAPAAGPHRSPTTHTRTHRTTSSVDDTAANANSNISINNDPPSSSSNVSRSNKKIVLSALDHQSTFKSVRLFSFGPMNAILRPRRKWYHRLDQSFVTDPTLELEFKHVYAKEVWRINKNWINFMWIFLLPLSMYDIINNTALSSSIVGYAWLVRLGGIGTGVWFYYYSQRYTYLKHMQPVSTFVVTVVGVVFITTTALTQALAKSYGVSFVLVLLCLVCMFLGLLFHSACVSVLIILVSWLIAASISEGGVPGILSLLIAGSVMYLETAYNGEREARHDFVRFRKLYHERLSTHSFLSNMLPPSVFEGLKREDQALVAHERIDADVLFSDIVGFTATAITLKPEDVVAVLNVMFATFDIVRRFVRCATAAAGTGCSTFADLFFFSMCFACVCGSQLADKHCVYKGPHCLRSFLHGQLMRRATSAFPSAHFRVLLSFFVFVLLPSGDHRRCLRRMCQRGGGRSSGAYKVAGRFRARHAKGNQEHVHACGNQWQPHATNRHPCRHSHGHGHRGRCGTQMPSLSPLRRNGSAKTTHSHNPMPRFWSTQETKADSFSSPVFVVLLCR